jgi:hypothetical protein
MTANQWDKLTKSQRADSIKRVDKTMRTKQWAHLVDAIASADFDDLTGLQQDMVSTMPVHPAHWTV